MQHKFLNLIGIVAVVIAVAVAYIITQPKGEIVMNSGIKTENMIMPHGGGALRIRFRPTIHDMAHLKYYMTQI